MSSKVKTIRLAYIGENIKGEPGWRVDTLTDSTEFQPGRTAVEEASRRAVREPVLEGHHRGRDEMTKEELTEKMIERGYWHRYELRAYFKQLWRNENVGLPEESRREPVYRGVLLTRRGMARND